jgi:iron complex outermembrane recepter protein
VHLNPTRLKPERGDVVVINQKFVFCSLLAGSSMLAVSAPAAAQTESSTLQSSAIQPDAGTPPTDSDDTGAQSPTESDAIVVTGSRVIKNGNNNPSPTTIASSEELLKVQPGQLNEAVKLLPVFAGSRGSSNNVSFAGGTTGGNGVANVLNLRNLGVRRTLTLLDGQRIPPTMFNGNVDVDLIPQMLVQRVDIVTGGVSAVYGSDAVSGVVNYVINKKFNGLALQANYGISSRGDGAKKNLGIAFGTEFADGRAHIEGSYEYRKEDGVPYRSSRSWLRQPGITGQGTADNPFVLIENVRQADYAFGGLINNGVLAGQVFKSDGVLSTFVHGETTGVSALEIGGDGAYYDGSLFASMRSHQFFGRFDYELSDSVEFYAEVLGNLKRNDGFADYVRLNNVILRSTNAFLAPQYQQALATAGQSTFRMRSFLSNAPRIHPSAEANQLVYKAGLTGKAGAYDWGLEFVYGKTKLHTVLGDNVDRRKLAASLDAVFNSAGQVVCRITVTNPGLADDCVPLNIFGPTAGSAEAYDYFLNDTDWNGVTEMPAVMAHVSGAPFSLPAGPVNMALSGEWRRTSFSATTASSAFTPYDCTGIQFNCTNQSRLYDLTLSEFPKTGESVWEVAFEFDAPIFQTGGMGLNINGAARYTSYQQSGEYVTWKVGADLRLTDTLRLRATRSRDIRAPNVFDLFAPRNPSIVTGTDLLTGLAYSLQTNGGGGNPNLKAEIGNTFTAGIVWKPMSNLSVALDYFHVTISDALSDISGRDTAAQNECYASGGSSPYCALQERANGSVADAIAAFNANPASVIGNPAYAATNWRSETLNVAQEETYGFDLEVNYATDLFRRPFSLRLLGAYQPHLYTRQPGIETVDFAGVGFGPDGFAAGAKLSMTAFARYQLTDSLTIDILHRWRDKLKMSGIASEVFASGSEYIPANSTTNLNLTYSLKTKAGNADFFLNVQNIFDNDPPLGGYTGNGSRAGLRDGFPLSDNPMGRYFTFGVRLSM